MTAQSELVEALVIRPGDTLLIRVHPQTSRDHAADLVKQVKERLPDLEVCVIAAEQLAMLRG